MSSEPEMVMICTTCGAIHADEANPRGKYKCGKCKSVLTRMPMPKPALPQAEKQGTGVVGKVIGAALGFAVAGPWGAAIGAAMGHSSDKDK